MATLERNRCRLCTNLIKKLEITDNNVISHIKILLQIHIEQNMDDRLPKNVCTRCTSTVNTMWKFHNKVHSAQKKLAKLIEIDVTSNIEHSQNEVLEISNELCQFTPVQKSDNSDPETVPQTDLYPESTGNIIDNVLVKFEIDQYSDVVNECPSEPIDDFDDQSYCIEDDFTDLVEYKPLSPIEELTDASLDSIEKPESTKLTVNLINKHKTKSKKSRVNSAKVPENSLVDSAKKSVIKHRSKSKVLKKVSAGKPVAVPRYCSKNVWPEYPWKCPNCGEMSSDVYDYRKHQCFASHQRFYCVDCSKAYCRQSLLFTHIKEDHWERYLAHLQLECDVCHTWFSNAEEQEAHRGLKHPEAGPRPPPQDTRPPKIVGLKCDVCGKIYKSHAVLRIHMKLHSGEKPYACDLCEKTYINKSQLSEHKKIHMGVRNFICDECGKSFINKGNLKGHLRTHSNDRPFICKVCGRGCKTNAKLRNHEAVHSGIKPHVCSECGDRFLTRNQLRRHSIRHSDERQYACDLCDKTFRMKMYLTVHQRQHTGEQPYTCPDCQRTFTNWPNCRKHMIRIHKRAVRERECKTV